MSVVKYIFVTISLVLLIGCSTNAASERLRGAYTYGHEVNVFCPEINSQCYWLGPNSNQAAREQLKQIYHDKKPGLYKPVCVVIDGSIDRESTRDGFAADYDGLIDIESVQGACDEINAITPGDLNHRRWVLAARNGVPVDAAEPSLVLDFGERLFVAGRNGAPDGFEQPFDSLDFTYFWYPNDRMTLKVKAQNLLNSTVEIEREGVTVFEEDPGTTFSLAFSWAL